jgi:AraC family transcriptional regulator
MAISLGSGEFLGQVRRSITVNGAVLAETGYVRGTRIAMHAHTLPLCCLPFVGGLMERRAHGSDHVAIGEVLFHPSHEGHSHYFPDDTRAFTVQFGGEWLASLERRGSPLFTTPRVLRNGTAPLQAARLHLETRRVDTASTLAIEGILSNLIAELMRVRELSERVAPRWLRRTTEALNSAYTSVPSLIDLAADAGVHPGHLARTFRRFTGCSPGEYLRLARLGRARRDLAEGRKPLSAVALDAGFYDQAHFTRVFRDRVGVTPGTYRRATRD